MTVKLPDPTASTFAVKVRPVTGLADANGAVMPNSAAPEATQRRPREVFCPFCSFDDVHEDHPCDEPPGMGRFVPYYDVCTTPICQWGTGLDTVKHSHSLVMGITQRVCSHRAPIANLGGLASFGLRGKGGGPVILESTGLALLASLSPTALLIAAVYLGSARPMRTAAFYLTGALVMTVVTGVVILVLFAAST